MPDRETGTAPCLEPPAGLEAHLKPASGDAVSAGLLGPFEFTHPGAGKLHLPKKAQALLAYLAMTRGRPFPRDVLATLLWGERETEQARQSLRQCLVSLRRAIGEVAGQILTADAATVTLARSDGLVVDIDRFTALSSSTRCEDMETACSLYRGEFLAGLTIAADGFSSWIAIERGRLASSQADLLLRLANAQAGAGDVEKALASARRMIALDPLREEAHRLLMRLMAQSGNQNGALSHYAQWGKLLHDELGVLPDRESAALADAIRTGALLTPAARRELPDSGGGPLSRPSGTGTCVPALPDKPSIAILPFANLSGEPDRDYFIRGLVDDMTVALGREKWLFVIASASASAAGSGTEPGADLQEIGARLGVRYVLRGSVRIDAGQALLVAQLNDVSHGHSIWSGRFQDEIDNVFALQERLTTRVAAAIAPALKAMEVERARRKATNDLTAFDLYLQALPRFRASAEANRQALTLLARAVELDPGYGAAYGLAARCYQFQKMLDWTPPRAATLEEGVRLGHLAAETGRDDSEALWMAGLALAHLSGEIDHAVALIDRSLSLNSNSADAWTASCLVRSYLGDSDSAIRHFDFAQRLNPMDQSQHLHWNIVAWAHIAAARYREAAEAADRTIHVQPGYLPGLRLKVAMSGLLGRAGEGRAAVEGLLAAQPRCSVSWMRAFLEAPLRKNPDMLETYLEGCRRAGLPEETRVIVSPH